MSHEKQREPLGTCDNQNHLLPHSEVTIIKGAGLPCKNWRPIESAAPAQPVPPKHEEVDLYCVPDENGWIACPKCRDAIAKERAAAPSPVLTQPSAEPLNIIDQLEKWQEEYAETHENGDFPENWDRDWAGYIGGKLFALNLHKPESERPVLPVPPSVEDLQLAKALHINYCEDLSGEGQAWEVPAEDEPEYFETLAEAIVFLHELPDKESESAISQLAQVCNELKDEVKLLRASFPAVVPTKYKDVCDTLREMATEKPDMRLGVAASVLLGALIPVTQEDIKRGQEIAKELGLASTAVAGRTQGDGRKLAFEAARKIEKNYGNCCGDTIDIGSDELAEELIAFEASLRESAREAPSKQVSNVVQAAESLLEWMPTCSRGSSGYSRRQTLEIALERLRSASPEAPAAKEK